MKIGDMITLKMVTEILGAINIKISIHTGSYNSSPESTHDSEEFMKGTENRSTPEFYLRKKTNSS